MTTESGKYMPGPWKAHYLTQHRMRVTTDLGVPSLGDDTICEIALWNVDYATQVANARLIAAAPDMLEALELCQAYLLHSTGSNSRVSNPYPKVDAALSKAKGETS